MSESSAAGAEAPAALLFVCTANMCRSPLAAALARRALAGAAVDIDSAGMLPGGRPVPDTGQKVAAAHGLDLRAHRSAELDSALLERADVVLTMTRAQARELVVQQPELWPRVFTVKQFARWLPMHRPHADGVSRAWLVAAAAHRAPGELLGEDPDDDTQDPMGRSARVWRAVTGELGAAIDEIAVALRPGLRDVSPPSTP